MIGRILLIVVLIQSTAWGQSWMQRADLPANGRHRAIGISIGNKGYMGMGHMNGTGVNIVYHDWWQYDPASNSWTQKADYANGVGQYGACAFATSQFGFVGGGTAFTNQFYKYDPISNTWTQIANCLFSPNDQTAFGIGDKGYAIDNTNVACYDPTTDVWTMVSPLPVSASVWGSSWVIGNSAFVKFGNLLFEYKASQDTWLQRASFPGSATGGSSAFAVNGKGYIVTGYAGSLAVVNKEVWEFNPAQNTWLQREDFEGSGRRFSCGFSIGNKGYFGLGTNGINFNDFWVFDGVAGINENDLSSLEIYPNPCSSSLTIQGDESINGTELYILDIQGKVLINQKFVSNNPISVESLLPGTYILRIQSGNKTIAYQRFIKN